MPFEYDTDSIISDACFTKIQNAVLDALCRYRIPGEEMQCLLVILRKTAGFGKKSDNISLSLFSELTGIKRQNVNRALKSLSSKKITCVIKKDDREVSNYAINFNYMEWASVIKKDSTPLNPVIKNDSSLASKMMPTKEKIKEKKNTLVDCFEKLWSDYPKKDGRKAAQKHFIATVKTDEDCQRIRTALDNYLAYLNTTATPQQFIKNGSTWFSNWQDWETPIQGPVTTTPQRDRETEQQLTELRRMGVTC